MVFVLAPLAILSGPSMSPALTNRFKWYPNLPGNRQVGRRSTSSSCAPSSCSSSCMWRWCSLTGFATNMNHIVMGAAGSGLSGPALGLIGIGVVIAVNALANWLAWRRPRAVQHVAKAIVTPVMGFLLDRLEPVAEFRRKDISPFFWANGKVPTCEEWKALAANDFKDYRLRVYGPVLRLVAE